MSDPSEGDLLTGGSDENPAGSADNPAPEGTGGPEGAASEADGSEKKTIGWRGQLSEALQNEERLGKFDGKGAIDKLATAYLEAEERLGKAVVLSDEPTDEELSRVRKRLGVPETPEGYDFSDLPEGVSLPEAAISELASLAHKGLISKEKAKEIVLESVKAVSKADKKRKEDVEAGLRKELGEDFDRYLKGAQTVLKQYGDWDILKGELKDSGLANSPELFKTLGKVAAAVSEGEAPRGERPPKATTSKYGFPVARQIAEENRFYDE